MTLEILEKELNNKILHNLYLFYGEEEFLLNNTVKKVKKAFGEIMLGINYIHIEESNIGSLISEIETLSFGYEKKLIIVKNSGLFKNTKAKELEYISKYINENINLIEQAVVIVFIEEAVNKTDLYKVIDENGIIYNFEKLRVPEISKRLKAICNAYKVNIDSNTMQFFIETCGIKLQVLINEIRKLIEYTGENGTITVETIKLLSTKELGSIIFDLTDYLGKKETAKALNTLKELIYNKEPVQKILVTLYGHFRKLYLTKIALEENINIAEALNLKDKQMFLINKYKKQAEYFNKHELRKILQELIDLDYNTKQGNIDINIGLEAILCAYCA